MSGKLSFYSAAKYTIIGEIGRGGMGVVFLAQRDCEGVADLLVLKTIKQLSSAEMEKLKNEARLAASLRHENIVRTYGLEAIPISDLPQNFLKDLENKPATKTESNRMLVVEAQKKIQRGETYSGGRVIKSLKPQNEKNKLFMMVMDYVQGQDLREVIMAHSRQKLLLPLMLGAFVVSRVCRALEYAHQVIVHRDLSPENILVNHQGVAKLTDFGVAMDISQGKQDFAGKLQYMSPEQLNLQKIDGRSDIFSMGLIAYQLATGISPLLPNSALVFKDQYLSLKDVVKEEIPAPHLVCKDIPIEYSNIILKMLSVSKLNRYQKMSDVCNDLEKKYLYSAGFGPTNNSMQSYMEILKNEFKDPSQQQLKSLSFLSDKDRKIHLKRKVDIRNYTKLGIEFAQDRAARSLLSILGLKLKS